MRFWIAFISLVTLLTGLSSWSDPISKEQADAWVAHVRRIMHWPPDFDVRAEAEERRLLAEARLQLVPNSREYKRDLADALHSLGHFFEHDHNFLAALKFHQQSLRLYGESQLDSRESFDGPAHALEHIFMDVYDHGVVLERQGKAEEADRYFKMAWRQARSGLLNQYLEMLGDRIQDRLISLRNRMNPLPKPKSDECRILLRGIRTTNP